MSKDQTRIAVVTGGASGIGEECARQLRDQGWRVVVWDRHAADGEPTVDVADYASVAAAASRLDGVDLLINAAGIAGSRDPVARKDPAEWAQVMAVNLNGTFHCAHALYEALRAPRRGGQYRVGGGHGDDEGPRPLRCVEGGRGDLDALARQ